MSETEVHKEKLLTEQKILYKELSELGFQDTTAPEDWVATPDDPAKTEADENLVADRKEEWIGRRGEVAALETRYNNIVKALGKIKDGTYGICEICNSPIEEDRLAVNPAARTCKEHLNDEAKLVE